MKISRILLAMVMTGLAMGCHTYHEVAVQPVEIKPIHITIDVNVKVDRALDDFFGDVYGDPAKGGASTGQSAPKAQ